MSDAAGQARGRPKVSVLMMAYNHAKYIRQSIDSVLMQKTNFAYEIVIGEDFSQDGTREIVVEYQQRHPEVIRALLTDRNVGAGENWRRVVAAAQGDYVAVLEGDDYWTWAGKLQVQADFLDAHPETTVCGHRAAYIYEGQDRPPGLGPDQKAGFYNLDELLRWNFLPTCSVMYRWDPFEALPDWYFKLKMGDWPLHMLMARHGNIAFLREPMAAYRLHAQGSWSNRGEIFSLQERIRLFRQIGEALDPKYEPIIRDRLFMFHHWLGVEHVAAGNLPEARQAFRQSLAFAGVTEHLWEKSMFALQAYTPGLLQWLRRLKRALQ